MSDDRLTVCHCLYSSSAGSIREKHCLSTSSGTPSGTSSGTLGSRSIRRGVTLFELLLVLAVLVLIGAIAWPMLEKPFAMQRLRYAGDQVRTVWARARNQAMLTGETCLFYYQPGGGQFYVQQASSVDAFAAPGDSLAFGADVPGGVAQSAAPTGERLPDDVAFAEGVTAEDPRVAGFGVGQAISSAVGADALSWAPPVAFFPDGTATSSQLILANGTGFRILVELRGMTGSSALGEVFSDQQVAR